MVDGKTGHEILGIVENMSYIHCPDCNGKIHTFEGKGGEKLSAALRSPLLVQIPMHTPGHLAPAPEVYPKDSPAGLKYRELADRVLTAT